MVEDLRERLGPDGPDAAAADDGDLVIVEADQRVAGRPEAERG